jgi:hypothetical protein
MVFVVWDISSTYFKMFKLDDKLHKDQRIQERFRELQTNFFLHLRKLFLETRKFGFIHATPMIVDANSNRQFKIVYESLMNVTRRICLNYLNDSELQKIIPLPKKAKSLLRACSHIYHMGTLRPDFLIDKDGNFFINEINARFPTNGYFISYSANAALSEMKIWKEKGISALKELKDAPSALERIVSDTLVLKVAEPDWDIALYREHALSNGQNINYVHPYLLKPKGQHIHLNQKFPKSFILELRQHEILDYFSSSFVSALQNYPHLNDIRTILIGHDKRLLAALSKKSILRRYAEESERRIICPHLIETLEINGTDNLTKKIRANKNDWVLKHALLGKGNRVYIGCEISDEKWIDACADASNGEFVAQRYVLQKDFSVYIPHLGIRSVKLSGMLLGSDGRFISQGVYKGIDSDPTRLWQSTLFILPAIKDRLS